MFQINTRGALLCSQAAIPLMRERGGGSIVNIGSCAAFVSGGNLTAYAISKSALYALTMSMAKTFAREKIRVNWITVGWVMTDNEIALQKSLGHDERWFEEMRRKMPIGEFQTPEDIAASCVFLASDEARHVTGSDIRATGGLCVNT
ncbi:MAG: 2-(S)-hydroxypropyl-CoM dehydrogenase [candidate division BRC1 bacterium ADurb.BinA364]|nr:MAG: 2-(S)-hydroxypropyl-CoM dehydrogenase [candidate division BRC1 bacterium ADurb.BinA364]